MHRSKLLDLVQTFSPAEWKSFGEFAASPYFNRQPAVRALVDWLAARAPEFTGADRAAAWAAVFPGEAYDDARLNHLMSATLRLAERFVGQEAFEADAFAAAFYRLRAVDARGLDKHFRHGYEKLREQLAAAPQRLAGHALQQYQLEHLAAARIERQGVRRHNEHMQRTADALDVFYLAEKLRCTCYMLTSQVVLATPYNLQLVDEVRGFLDRHAAPAGTPAVEAYYRVLRLLMRADDADDDFGALKSLVSEQEGEFDGPTLAELYGYAINYCILQIMKVQERYVGEALALYRRGVERGILLEHGQLSPWHYKNIIKLALRLRQYDWTEGFIRQYTDLLPPEHRAPAFNFNLAELYYYTGRYDLAMHQLHRIEFTDVHYNLGTKVLLAKIYYESQSIDALESLLHAFKIYLLRNRVISDDIRRTYLNFISLLGKIMQATPERRTSLRERIEKTPLLTEKNWLVRVIG